MKFYFVDLKVKQLNNKSNQFMRKHKKKNMSKLANRAILIIRFTKTEQLFGRRDVLHLISLSKRKDIYTKEVFFLISF